VIPARKLKWFELWFAGHVQRRLRRTFGALRVRGLPGLREASRNHPVLVVSNHTSWWDPMVCIHLATRILDLDGYALMDAENLTRYPFLGRIGGFGVRLDDPGDCAAGVRYAVRLLDAPRRGLWLFPQGGERPAGAALSFQRGAAAIARLARLQNVFPAGLKYVFGGREKPEAYCSIGAPLGHEADDEVARERQERAVAAELARIDSFLCGEGAAGEFETVFESKTRWPGTLAERLLARITRYH
jgi:1-acyl-sn-glycerol-3-phosphate acyltransferase